MRSSYVRISDVMRRLFRPCTGTLEAAADRCERSPGQAKTAGDRLAPVAGAGASLVRGQGGRSRSLARGLSYIPCRRLLLAVSGG